MTTPAATGPLQLETVGCYNCGSWESTPYDAENGFELVRCTVCGLLYVSPRPALAEIEQAHLTGLHRGDAELDSTGQQDAGRIRRYLSVLADLYPDRMAGRRASWLDVGCGFGEFLEALELHFEGRVAAVGSEPNAHKRRVAIARGLQVDYFDLDAHAATYDFLSLLNVYSHLPDPVATLSVWKRLLAPGGELVLETGHSSHLPREKHHRPYYLPDHLSFANRQIVCALLERIGFEILEVRRYRAVFYPDLTGRALVGAAKRVLLRRNGLRAMLAQLFPPEPNRDMYIRARLRSD